MGCNKRDTTKRNNPDLTGNNFIAELSIATLNVKKLKLRISPTANPVIWDGYALQHWVFIRMLVGVLRGTFWLIRLKAQKNDIAS